MQRVLPALCIGLALLLSAAMFVGSDPTHFQKQPPQPYEVVLDFNAIPFSNCIKSPECSKEARKFVHRDERLFKLRPSKLPQFDPDRI
jgi:hypothetical protein